MYRLAVLRQTTHCLPTHAGWSVQYRDALSARYSSVPCAGGNIQLHGRKQVKRNYFRFPVSCKWTDVLNGFGRVIVISTN